MKYWMWKYRTLVGKYLPVLLVCTVLQGCMDKSYNGIAPDGSSPYYTTEQLPVLLVIGVPDNIISKGTGAIDYDEDDPWADKEMFFYAFKRDLSTSFSDLSKDSGSSCLIDGSRDGENNIAGKAARKNTMDQYIAWTGIERNVLYPPDYIPYDFYGYFIDDMEISARDITRTEDAITIAITIDGSQDVMSAMAELTDEQLNGHEYTDREKMEIMNYSFSSFTAQRGIHPTFLFNHHLSRLRFSLSAGSTAAENVYVDSIKVMSKARGIFTVAHKSPQNMGVDFSAETEYRPLALTEDDGSRLRTNTYHTDGGVKDLPVGGSLLLAPDDEYEVHMFVSETTSDGKKHTYENIFTIRSNSGSFSPGTQYSVRVTIYGLQSVYPSVTLEPWGYGGHIIIDDDQWM